MGSHAQGREGRCTATTQQPSTHSHTHMAMHQRHTSHVTRHTSHVTRHTSQATSHSKAAGVYQPAVSWCHMSTARALCTRATHTTAAACSLSARTDCPPSPAAAALQRREIHPDACHTSRITCLSHVTHHMQPPFNNFAGGGVTLVSIAASFTITAL